MNKEGKERMVSKFFFVKITSFLFVLTFFLAYISQIALAGGLPAEKGLLGDVSWYVEEREGRIFYSTHGTAVYGHEFGFFKNPGDCENDILWLTFSSNDEKVKDFVGKEVTVSLAVDGEIIEIGIDMLFASTMGFTQVMYFTNWVAGEQLIDILTRGRYVEVKIVGPKELEALLDIKFDEFNLEGFADSRKEAGKICRDSSPDTRQEENPLALLVLNGCGN